MTPGVPTSFGVVLTCIDGRSAPVVHRALCLEWGVEYVDLVTLPGPEALVSELPETHAVWDALGISVRQHGSTRAAVVAHTDCAANDVDDQTRREQVRETLLTLRDLLRGVDVTGWVVDTGTGTMEEVE